MKIMTTSLVNWGTLFLFTLVTQANALDPTLMLELKTGLEWTYEEEWNCLGSCSGQVRTLTRKNIRLDSMKSLGDSTELHFRVDDSIYYPNRILDSTPTSTLPVKMSYWEKCLAFGGSISCPNTHSLDRIFTLTAVDTSTFVNRGSREERLLTWMDETSYFMSESWGEWKARGSTIRYFKQGIGTVHMKTHQMQGVAETNISMTLISHQGRPFDLSGYLLNFINAYRLAVSVRPVNPRLKAGITLSTPWGMPPSLNYRGKAFLLDGRVLRSRDR